MELIALSHAGITVQEYNQMKRMNQRLLLPEKFQRKLSLAERLNIDEIKSHLASKGIGYITLNDACYPPLLREIHDPPYILYFKGDPSLLHRRTIAIVGSRKSSRYTYESLREVIPGLKKLSVVSGLAYGADEAAHRLCLSCNIPTVGVLAFGHDIHYPRSTYDLRIEMERHHLTISEYPPATPVDKWRFVARNRIIAGLSEGVLVTEAEEKSGSLITLDMAVNENRNIYCLPGNITSKLSRGTNLRIQEGAEIVLTAEDILKDFH
ncbi:DNA-processing protein DprA [Lacicoccus alkaliphilus]|uniref:DNA processing protein n=1 Tax=Lacicoccus alkaliphilus DSM 16010 TaxID=1123231 RepID=A0A1M7C797_9BACL|nr:DNA-processing protein DprA [Salinicoccus alkaliphilus]SHL63027.1 DNA processing protein [Salinicoccus alkaliphilus DSM 16010]